MQEERNEFQDPSLKAALKRAIGGEVAPESLRQRILQAARAEPEALVVPMWRHPAFRIAAAFLLALIGVYTVMDLGSPKATVPQAMLVGMATRHDRCDAGEHDHHQRGVPQDDFHLMGQSLAARLKISVLAADLRSEGWTFRGAATCPVNGVPAAHLLFGQAHESLSLFSIPPGAAADGDIVVETVAQHPMAVFVRGGVTYAAVGHGNVSETDVRGLLAKHRDEIVAAAVAMGIGPRQEHMAR